MTVEDPIYVNVNGKIEQMAPGTTVRTLILSKGLNPNVVACELNMKILKRATLDKTVLNEGDTLEIIQMIGGG